MKKDREYAAENRGTKEIGSEELVGWDEVTKGIVLTSFDAPAENIVGEKSENRKYSEFNSYTATVASWRVIKPVFNDDLCIDCQNCWVWCPDSAIIARDKELVGIDYDHCKGCEICVEVCPTNPKALLMFDEHADNEKALSSWPEKKKKEKKIKKIVTKK